MSNIFKINWSDIGGAVLSAVIVSVLTYLGTLTSIWDANLDTIINVAILTAVASLVKAFGTDNGGNFLGAIRVK